MRFQLYASYDLKPLLVSVTIIFKMSISFTLSLSVKHTHTHLLSLSHTHNLYVCELYAIFVF